MKAGSITANASQLSEDFRKVQNLASDEPKTQQVQTIIKFNQMPKISLNCCYVRFIKSKLC